jgi:hypothetical protein
MFWFAVRSWRLSGLLDGVALGLELALPDAPVLGVADVLVLGVADVLLLGADAELAVPEAGWACPSGSPAEPEAVLDGWALADDVVDGSVVNSLLLAGTSSWKETKICLSSGSVHRTFAVSDGTTSERGYVGSVKKAILSDGMAFRLSTRLYTPWTPPIWLSTVRDLVPASRNL